MLCIHNCVNKMSTFS